MFLGCHLSVAGGYGRMGEDALRIGADTFQFFSRNPRGGGRRESDPEDVAALREILSSHRFGPLIVHAPYVYNPASPDDAKYGFASEAMAQDLEWLERNLPGQLYNFHPGSHVGTGTEAGIRRIASLLNGLLPLCRTTTVLLETMAGKGSEIGSRFEELAGIIALVDPACRHRLGVCLDTCHVSDAGYPIAEETDAVLDEFDRIIGLDRLKAVHLNDSMNPVGSRKDRHARLGEGTMTERGLLSICGNERLKGLPFCLETPNDLSGYAGEIAWVRNSSIPVLP